MATKQIEKKQYEALCALAFMFLRMGQNEKAKTIHKALLSHVSGGRELHFVYKNLAVIALHEKEYELCLEYLREALKEEFLKTKDSVLYLVKAEALWHSGRENESKMALQEFYKMTVSN